MRLATRKPLSMAPTYFTSGESSVASPTAPPENIDTYRASRNLAAAWLFSQFGAPELPGPSSPSNEQDTGQSTIQEGPRMLDKPLSELTAQEQAVLAAAAIAVAVGVWYLVKKVG